MIIKNAVSDDKEKILEFCKNTFSWGDYIDLVWDHWITEDNLLCIYDDAPIGICHVSISKNANQIWIEGIRIHPKYRRKGLATKLIKQSELTGIKKRCQLSYMLIEHNNTSSLELAQKLNYKILETWTFYSIKNSSRIKNSNADLAKSIEDFTDVSNQSFKFVDSWRWFPFNNQFIHNLISNRNVIYIIQNNVTSTATIIPSQHFSNTIVVTILFGNQSGIDEIIKFVQNYSYQNGINRIQLLINNNFTFHNSEAEKRLMFHLMQKNIFN